MKILTKVMASMLYYWWIVAGVIIGFEGYRMVTVAWELGGLTQFVVAGALLLVNGYVFDSTREATGQKNYNLLPVVFGTVAFIIIFAVIRISYVTSHPVLNTVDSHKVEIISMADDNGVVLYRPMGSCDVESVVSKYDGKEDYFKLKFDYLEGKECFLDTKEHTYPGTEYNTTKESLNCYIIPAP